MVDSRPNELFLGLITSLQMSAWMQLGKVMHPMTGKIERDLQHAKESIDLLGMLEEKTRGNLHPEESRLLGRILYELRMNYVEEIESEKAKRVDPAPGEGESIAASPETRPGSAAPGGAPHPSPGVPEHPPSSADLRGPFGSEGGGPTGEAPNTRSESLRSEARDRDTDP